ncbi:hypothetical protein TSMEX_011380 [Taenia solium]|eukprot:TsM_000335800 transcript=TsM_000335800 gene=TsM_000335800
MGRAALMPYYSLMSLKEEGEEEEEEEEFGFLPNISVL